MTGGGQAAGPWDAASGGCSCLRVLIRELPDFSAWVTGRPAANPTLYLHQLKPSIHNRTYYPSEEN